MTETSSSSATNPDGTSFPFANHASYEHCAWPGGSRGTRLAFAHKNCKGPRFAWEPPGDIVKKAGGAPFIRNGSASDRQEVKGRKMALYEHVFLARQDLSQAQVDALAAQATEIVEAGSGKVTKTETWGLKSLAYKIERNRKAHFVLLNIEAPGSVVAELERQTRINEDVIRYMTIRVDEHEEGPSVMMRKNERERKRRDSREERD
jgi:small subunit ribosomal protein S6